MHLSQHEKLSQTDKVGDFLSQDGWVGIPQSTQSGIVGNIRQVTVSEDDFDTCIWKLASYGIFMVKVFYQWLQVRHHICSVAPRLWHKSISPSHSIICRKAFSGYIATHDKLQNHIGGLHVHHQNQCIGALVDLILIIQIQ